MQSIADAPQRHYTIVYYGPCASGRSTSVHYVYQHLFTYRKQWFTLGALHQRLYFFDALLPIGDTQTASVCHYHVYTNSGASLYAADRMALLARADAVIFVADSTRDKLQENIASLREAQQGLSSVGKSLATIPVVLQYNKRDLPRALPISALNHHLNPYRWPTIETCAATGQEVMATWDTLQHSIHQLQTRQPSPARHLTTETILRTLLPRSHLVALIQAFHTLSQALLERLYRCLDIPADTWAQGYTSAAWWEIWDAVSPPFKEQVFYPLPPTWQFQFPGWGVQFYHPSTGQRVSVYWHTCYTRPILLDIFFFYEFLATHPTTAPHVHALPDGIYDLIRVLHAVAREGFLSIQGDTIVLPP